MQAGMVPRSNGGVWVIGCGFTGAPSSQLRHLLSSNQAHCRDGYVPAARLCRRSGVGFHLCSNTATATGWLRAAQHLLVYRLGCMRAEGSPLCLWCLLPKQARVVDCCSGSEPSGGHSPRRSPDANPAGYRIRLVSLPHPRQRPPRRTALVSWAGRFPPASCRVPSLPRAWRSLAAYLPCGRSGPEAVAGELRA